MWIFSYILEEPSTLNLDTLAKRNSCRPRQEMLIELDFGEATPTLFVLQRSRELMEVCRSALCTEQAITTAKRLFL